MTHRQHDALYPAARIDSLTDGIFAVAMTLLVLDIRLPENLAVHDGAGLLQALMDLWPKFVPYALSFMVLGLRWLSSVQVRSRAEFISGAHLHWWMVYMLLITCVPFSTIVVGRYVHLAPAIWLYGGNTALIALASMRMLALTPELELSHHLRRRQISLLVLLASSLLSVVWSFVNPNQALWALALNMASPALDRWSASNSAA